MGKTTRWLLCGLTAAALEGRAQVPPPGDADGGIPASGPAGTASLPVPQPPELKAPPSVPPPPLKPGMGRIAGKVTLAGLAPRLVPLPVGRDLKICGATKPDESLEVGGGGAVRNAVLWLAEGPPPRKGDRPPKVKLDQAGCSYVPHLVATTVGATLDIVNSDPLLHNVHGREGEKTLFNYAMPIKGYVIPRKLPAPGFVTVNCEVHPWMRAVVAVLPTTAYAVTDAQGNYFIDVAPGKYTVKLRHERLGERSSAVEVQTGKAAALDVELTPR